MVLKLPLRELRDRWQTAEAFALMLALVCDWVRPAPPSAWRVRVKWRLASLYSRCSRQHLDWLGILLPVFAAVDDQVARRNQEHGHHHRDRKTADDGARQRGVL